VLVDACHSGIIIGKSAAEQSAVAKQLNDAFVSTFINEFSKSGRSLAASDYYVITAARSSELSWEGTINGTRVGFFTYSLCYGSGWDYSRRANTAFPADTNKDRTLTLHEVYAYSLNLAFQYVPQSAQVYPVNSTFTLFEY